MKKNKLILFAMALFLAGSTGCKSTLVKDIEGNSYITVTIGTNVWIAENLRTTKFNDGSAIPLVPENDTWTKLQTPAFAWYNNDPESNSKTYGALYNWYAINTGKVCPAGWHVATEKEWSSLHFLEGSGSIGGNLKEAGTTHWKSPNTDATNATGFTGLPGGYRSIEGVFNYIRISGYWWCSTSFNDTYGLFYYLRFKSGVLFKSRSEKYCGFSVRCVKDI
jgi:uncharacterized protein (TIGR02145 family)